jgi:hypothetical protein
MEQEDGDMSTLQNKRLTDSFTAPIGDSMTRCTMELQNDWSCKIEFMYRNTPYVLVVTTNNASFIKLISRYMSQTGDSQYASIDPVTGGVVATPTQREEFAKAMARHAIGCLNQVVTEQGRAVLDYAVWYREHMALDTLPLSDAYSAALQKHVCHFIVHTVFIAGTVSYTKTHWSPV